MTLHHVDLVRKLNGIPGGLESWQNLGPEIAERLHLIGGSRVAAGSNYDQMVETELEDRLEALYAMSGRSGDCESIDKRVIDELRVTGISSRMPRHIVRFANFPDDCAIFGTHSRRRIARHS